MGGYVLYQGQQRSVVRSLVVLSVSFIVYHTSYYQYATRRPLFFSLLFVVVIIMYLKISVI